jgi:Stealth protein CR2, conserved region 2/Stealth protein CR1, conserved region 1/Stealth protein CR3, conserved region 3
MNKAFWHSFICFLVSLHFCFAESFPIDVVYTWVDGNDSEWKKIKNYHLAIHTQNPLIVDDSSSDSRFNDHEELRYSLRSIHEFAPFVRHIFIVTMGQKPKWINDHEKITFIDHKDIFLNPSDLPTFNSQAIEAHLHRIKGLCDHFIYFNDDVFLGKPLSELDFFSNTGEPIVFMEPNLSPRHPLPESATFYRKAWANTNKLLDRLYQKSPRFRLRHAPFSLRKSLIEESEKIFPHVFETNSSHKFRSELDHNLTNGLLQYDWYYRGKCVIGQISNLMVSLRSCAYQDLNTLEFKKLLMYEPATFCIEDVTDGYCEEAEALMHEFLNQKYPHKAPWEK